MQVHFVELLELIVRQFLVIRCDWMKSAHASMALSSCSCPFKRFLRILFIVFLLLLACLGVADTADIAPTEEEEESLAVPSALRASS